MSTYIVNDKNNYKYIIKGIATWNDEIEQGVTDFTLPEGSPEDTMIMRLEGQSRTITLNFSIFDDGTDRSDGTYSSQVITTAQQKDYLRNHIFTADMDASWTITDSENAPSGITCTIERVTMVDRGGDPNTVDVTVSLIVGSVVS